METPKSAAPSRIPPVRDDCWSEAATWTLVNAWGSRFAELNRGNLRQNDWRAVVDAVNDAHGDDLKSRRTDVQCKNRLDTLKKKYKAEKARVSESNEESTWPFYERMDELIGCVVTARKTETPLVTARKTETPLVTAKKTDTPPVTAKKTDTPPAGSIFPVGIPLLRCRFEPVPLVPQQKRPAPVANDSPFSLTSGPMGIPLLPNQKPMGAQTEMMIPQKRAALLMAAPVVDDSHLSLTSRPMGIPLLPNQKPMGAQSEMMIPQKRAASLVAAPVVAAPVVDNSHLRGNYSAVAAAVVEDNDMEDSDSAEEVEEGCDEDGMSRLAKAIDKLGEMYERVEGEKQKQLIELEKQRIQFAKDMEVERMKLFMETQVQLEKIKKVKRSSPNGEILAFAASQPFGNF